MDSLYLAIESSCDETACAVVRGDGAALSNAIASQIDLHSRFGGVVPELASRAHVMNVLPMIEQALDDAGVSMRDISAIAVTRGPGLVGSLLAGFETAKALGFARNLPVYAIHHVAAHVHSPFIHGPAVGANGFLPEGFAYPYLALAVSGGHSSLILAESPERMRTIGRTRDDAAGEAYDKVAKLLGLPYPGGPVIDRLAAQGDLSAYRFTRPRFKDGEFEFSFSGIKAAVARLVEDRGPEVFAEGSQAVLDLAASFQATVIDILLETARKALRRYKLRRLAIVGGVACNRGLRSAAAERFKGVELTFPPASLCTDNAAMIGALAVALGDRATRVTLDMNVDANLKMHESGD